MLGTDWDSTSIWDEETGETFGEALGRFEGLAPEWVEAVDVPRLVRDGFEVWSFGYGDDPEYFTTIDLDDLETFEDDIEEAKDIWGPFRYDPGQTVTPPIETSILGVSPVSTGR